jgi:nicotinate phosphoribosyltransferase
MMVSKAARIGGFDKTTNVMYAKTIGENPVGTIGHSFILSYDSESSAFDAIVSYALEHHLKYPTFLVDTYEDVLNSATMAIEKASLAGFSKVGIRIDSGNLLEQARLILSIGDRYNVRVAFTFSDNLNEKSIPEIYEFYQETRCDVAVLVGTQLAQPADIVKAVYKVSEIDSRLVCKRSSDVSKRTLSGDIQVYRQHSGYFYLDVVSNDVQYNGTGLPILIPAYSTIRELPKPVVSSSVDFTTNSIKVQLDVK